MTLALFLTALWLYAGRSLLLVLLQSNSRINGIGVTKASAFSVGLLITPLIIAIASLFSRPFYIATILLVLFDILLIAICIQKIRFSRNDPRDSWISWLYGCLFCVICLTLGWTNGPFIEHLTDAWWHMRSSAWVLNNDLTLPSSLIRHAGHFGSNFEWIGINYSSYRLQGLLAWISDASVLESWIASGVIVCGLLGASVLFLFSSIQTSRVAIFMSMLFWLFLLGGMNSGFRLTGWPAGMSYVFLNIALLASFQLFNNFKSTSAWSLFFICIVGMSLFHIGEIFIIGIGLLGLFGVKMLFSKTTIAGSVFLLTLFLAGVAALFAISTIRNIPASPTAFMYTGLTLVGFWIVAECLKRTSNQKLSMIGISIIFILFGYVMIDWSHVLDLFRPKMDIVGSYYAGYIPEWIQHAEGGYLRLAKWEHQLRASILWSGVLSIILVLWLFWKYKGNLSTWLLILTMAPILILVSPQLFTVLLTIVPEHGAYRVQFLMPVALVLGIASEKSIYYLINPACPDVKRHWLSDIVGNETALKIIQQAIVLVAIYVGYLIVVKVIDNFIPSFGSRWYELAILLVGVCAIAVKLSPRKIVESAILILCLLVAIPDFIVRIGYKNDRPWAVHTNQGFHWRLVNNKKIIEAHTSLRYLKDINSISKLLGREPTHGFISDLATSYYVSAETTLQPLVQQDHHSINGELYLKKLTAFCKTELSAEEFKSNIDEYNESIASSDKPEIHYMIVNRDTLNYTAEYNGAYCVGETDHISTQLENIANRVFEGKFLSLWKFRTP